ncbi:MAG TPA: hypothetical protein VKD72_28815 [Gemmataceae bacterium]|nr:hypothetical protein [Gemmataceae bacterium]
MLYTKESFTFGVFVHSTGPQGGIVVRTMINGEAAAPYRAEDALRVYKRKVFAQRYADRLNGAA